MKIKTRRINLEERNRGVKCSLEGAVLYKLLFFSFLFLQHAWQRTRNKSRTVDSIDLKNDVPFKKFHRAYIIGASITFRVKIVAEMKLRAHAWQPFTVKPSSIRDILLRIDVEIKPRHLSSSTKHITFFKKEEQIKSSNKYEKTTRLSSFSQLEHHTIIKLRNRIMNSSEYKI